MQNKLDSGPGIEDNFHAPLMNSQRLRCGVGHEVGLSRTITQEHGGTLTLLDDIGATCFRLMLRW